MEHQSSPLPLAEPGGFRWRLAIPMLLALIGASLLVGCIYLPFPEHKVGPEKDFRPLVAGGRRPAVIRPGIQRAAVIAILGKPNYEGKNALGYRLYTESGLWVWPLCFQATSAKRWEYGINLMFDQNNALIRVESKNADASEVYFFQMLPGSPEAIPFDDVGK